MKNRSRMDMQWLLMSHPSGMTNRLYRPAPKQDIDKDMKILQRDARMPPKKEDKRRIFDV